jgi:hypothetical protein
LGISASQTNKTLTFKAIAIDSDNWQRYQKKIMQQTQSELGMMVHLNTKALVC